MHKPTSVVFLLHELNKIKVLSYTCNKKKQLKTNSKNIQHNNNKKQVITGKVPSMLQIMDSMDHQLVKNYR